MHISELEPMSKIEEDFLKEKGISRTEPFNNVFMEKNDYIIKTANSIDELIKTFKIRYQVYGEFYAVKPPVPLDIDEFDKHADHIIVMHKPTDEVLGTYRVLSSDNVDSFYTEREFNLDEFKKTAGRICEMGRATVVPNSRSGAVINLLWRGVGDYIKKVKADHLIGCATFWGLKTKEPLLAWHYFKDLGVLLDVETKPLNKNLIEGWDEMTKKESYTEDQLKEIKKTLPPLVKSYIKAGACFGFEPAKDKKLCAIDFFAACKLTNLPDNLVKKYL